VYATVARASRAALGGLVGLVSCVSCTLPVVAALLSSVAGGSAAVTAAATVWSYDLSTLVFLGAIALLVWQPLAERRPSILVSRQQPREYSSDASLPIGYGVAIDEGRFVWGKSHRPYEALREGSSRERSVIEDNAVSTLSTRRRCGCR